MPDIVARETFADYAAGRDPALAAALSYNLPPGAAEIEPIAHWLRPSQWLKTGDSNAPRTEFAFDW
jgi:hypothetical protein